MAFFAAVAAYVAAALVDALISLLFFRRSFLDEENWLLAALDPCQSQRKVLTAAAAASTRIGAAETAIAAVAVVVHDAATGTDCHNGRSRSRARLFAASRGSWASASNVKDLSGWAMLLMQENREWRRGNRGRQRVDGEARRMWNAVCLSVLGGKKESPRLSDSWEFHPREIHHHRN